MALKLGWKPGDKRLSHYWQDPSVDWEATPQEKKDAYLKDGDASHLTVKNGATPPPTKIHFRALTGEEMATIEGLCKKPFERLPGESASDFSARWDREGGVQVNTDKMLFWCFRVGVEMPEESEAKKVLADFGLKALPESFVNALVAVYGTDIVHLYGNLVWRSSRLTEDEGKA